MSAYDLAIVGGGPAGMAAAEVAAGAGLSVALIDEQQRYGGQILRQPPASFGVADWLPGTSYVRLKAQLARAEALPIETLFGMSVHSAYRTAGEDGAGFELLLAGAEGGRRIAARRLLIASGCYDMPVAFPGWTLPGVSSAGAVQAFVKAQRLVPGERFVLAGTHPLQLVLADQIVRAGGQVVAVLFAQPAARALGMLRAPVTALTHWRALAAAAAAMARLVRAGVPIRFGQTVVAAEGEAAVTAARIAEVRDGAIDRALPPIACDRIATCFGFLPQSDLPRALGATALAIEGTGGWRIAHDEWMRSSVAGLWVAGEVTGVAGAEVSLAEGRLAGVAIARDAGGIGDEAQQCARPIRRRLGSDRRFAQMLAELSDPFPLWPQLADSETILCRCEDIPRATVADAVAAEAHAGAGAIKRSTRIGMGRCQGRGCEHALLAMLRTGRPEHGFAARMPIRPVAIGAFVETAPAP
jgi:thioredoxin reductase